MSMKTIALTAATLGLTTTAAIAGGYAGPVVEIAPEVQVTQPLGWSGAYIGGFVGRGSGRENVGVGYLNDHNSGTMGELEISGTTWGLRAGYRQNFFGPFLSAVELGYEAGGMEDSVTGNGYTATDELDRAISLRFKTGMLMGDKTWLYGIAGISHGTFDYTLTGAGDWRDMALKESFSHTGRIIGLGVEQKFTERLSVTGEWEYLNYGKTHLEDAAGGSTKATPDWHAVKLGLNYQF